MSINGKSVAAISPLLVFVVLYLVTSIIVRDFYKVPITVAFMVSSVYAVATMRGVPLEERVKVYSQGAGFAEPYADDMDFYPCRSLCRVGQSYGGYRCDGKSFPATFAGQPAVGRYFSGGMLHLAFHRDFGRYDCGVNAFGGRHRRETGAGLPLLVAIVAGGAFFGDNLSFISDTTITATRTQGCKLSDKFKVNSQIVMPAAAIAFALYIFMGVHIHAPQQLPEVDWIKVVPYLVVLVTAVVGVNVMVVLVLGLVLSGVVGVFTGTYDLFGWFAAMGEGITGMGELIIITMMAGGLMEIIRYNGGIDYILHALTRHIRSKRGAELSIAALVSVINLCTANNTVAIITAGPLAHDIAGRYGVDKRKSASILDTFSCFTQGLIPYGAQLLMAAGLASINPIDIIPYLYYPFIMGACALLSILFRYPRKYS